MPPTFLIRSTTVLRNATREVSKKLVVRADTFDIQLLTAAEAGAHAVTGALREAGNDDGGSEARYKRSEEEKTSQHDGKAEGDMLCTDARVSGIQYSRQRY